MSIHWDQYDFFEVSVYLCLLLYKKYDIRSVPKMCSEIWRRRCIVSVHLKHEVGRTLGDQKWRLFRWQNTPKGPNGRLTAMHMYYVNKYTSLLSIDFLHNSSSSNKTILVRCIHYRIDWLHRSQILNLYNLLWWVSSLMSFICAFSLITDANWKTLWKIHWETMNYWTSVLSLYGIPCLHRDDGWR